MSPTISDQVAARQEICCFGIGQYTAGSMCMAGKQGVLNSFFLAAYVGVCMPVLTSAM